MRTNRKTYNFFNRLSAALMVVTLLWLTVSTPFVFAAKEEIAKKNKSALQLLIAENEEEATSPLGGTEEKAPGSVNLAEEFLHDHSTADYIFSIISQYQNNENVSTYIAFHGELLVPPPNFS